MNIKRLTLFAIILSLMILSVAIVSVSADINVNTYTPSKDFSVTTSDTVNMCACSSYNDYLTVTNTGTWPAIFSISADNQNIAFSQSSFELNPGQTKQVAMSIAADCNKGNSDVSITVASNLGVQKTVTKSISIDRCQNIEAWVSNYSKDMEPCQSKDLTIFVKNVGPFKEEYALSSNYDEYIAYNSQDFFLEPNQTAQVTASVKPDCSVYGIKDITFDVQSVNNKLTAELPAQLIILQDYDYDLKINNQANLTNYQVCNRVSSINIPFTIKNTGATDNTYTFDIKGMPSYVKNDVNTVTLKPGQQQTFTFNIDSSTLRYEHKNYDVEIVVTPKYGDIVKTEKFQLNFLPCYEPQVVIYDDGNSGKYPLKTCSEYLYNYDVEVINNGMYKETYNLTLDGNPSGVKLSKNILTVSPGKRDSVKLIILGQENNKLYNVKVTATMFNGLAASDDTWIQSYDKESCHAVSFEKSYVGVNYQTQFVSIPLKNSGITDGKYVVYWNGSNILNLDDTNIAINVSKTKTVTLAVNTAGLKEGQYNGSLIVENVDSDASYSDAVSVTLKDKSIFTKAFEYFAYGNMCSQISLYQVVAMVILIILIILFATYGPHYQYNFWNRLKSKTSAAIILIVLFLIALILVITFAGFPQTQSQVYNLTTNTSELRFEWLQNDKYTLDASKFFIDQDNNTLHYNMTGLQNIKSIVNSNVITLYPNLGWSGTEHGRIVAYDNYGTSTPSPNMTFIVRSVPRKGVLELYNIYCTYVNLVIFALVLILVFVMVFVKQKVRKRK